jgi:PAS domain S-box-containing protein
MHTILLQGYKKAIDINIITSVTDQYGTILYVNKKFCEVSQYTEEELLGYNHRIINSGFHPSDFFAEMWTTIRSGNIWQGEIKNKAKDGSFYWVDTLILPVQHQTGTQYLSLRILITERKNLEAKKEEYLKSLEEIVQLVSHTLRKPLVSILGLMQLDPESLTETDRKKFYNYLKASASDLDNFTKEFTDYIYIIKNRLR